MKPAIVVADMIEDFIRLDGPLPVGDEAIKIIPSLQRLIGLGRQKGFPVIYANDALMPGDFLFRSRMKPHAIRGTSGARVIDELRPEPSDVIVHKRRFSAFFKTNLEITLKEWNIDTIVLGGVATEVCILATAYDGVCHDFEVVVVTDCCASRLKETHGKVVSILEKSPLYPLLKVMSLADFSESCA